MKDTQPRKKNWRDRYDGYYLKGLDSMHILLPYIMGTRTQNEAVMGEVVDLTEVDKYLEKKNADNPEYKYTWFQVIAAVVAKTILLRPKMNYFISGGHYYERKQIQLAFVVKRQFKDDGEEALAKFVLDPEGGSPLEQLHTYLQKIVHRVRKEDKAVGVDKAMDLLSVLPRPAWRLVSWILHKLEYYGHYPKSLAKDDPCYASAFISNLGSIKMKANYHHLYDWGTVSLFMVISEKKPRPFWHEDGTYDLRNTIELGLTVDERIADGYYFAQSLKIMRHLFAHPELLDLDAATPVEIDK